jgi:uracil-DNA glycosylase
MAKKSDIEQLIGSSWTDVLWRHFSTPYMKSIMQTLKKHRQKYKVLPDSDKVFRAYIETPFDEVRVCIIGQDPYPNIGDANGLAFSVDRKDSNNINLAIPPSLRNIFKELEDDLGFEKHRNIVHDPDLSRWAKQGILLLNTSLTVIANNPGSHSDIGWKFFTGATINALAGKEDMIFVAWGRHAIWTIEHYGDVMRNHFIRSAHPSPYSAHKGFFGSKPFSKVNKILESLGSEPITW